MKPINIAKLVLGVLFVILFACQTRSKNSALVMVTLSKDADFSDVIKWVDIYDHYFEPTNDILQRRILGAVEDRNLKKLQQSKMTVQVLDDSTSNRYYYWVHYRNDSSTQDEQIPGKIIYSVPQKSALVRLTTPTVPWPHGVKVVPVVFRPINPKWISPRAYKETLKQHMMPLPPNVTKIQSVDQIIQSMDPTCAEVLLNQLTGNAPIQVAGSPYTVKSRHICSADIDPLLDWMKTELTTAGLNVTMDNFTYNDPGCPNRKAHRQLIATIPGSDLGNQLFLVTAHIDAVQNTSGADDNASGVVAMVCAAKALAKHKFRRTIQFVAFSAEEQGLRGSRDYVNDLMNGGPYEICGAFNMDMIAYDKDNDRKFQIQSNPGDAASAFIRDRLGETISVYGINLNPVLVCDNDNTTDQGSFWLVGKPAVLAGEEFFCEVPLSSCDWEAFCLAEDFNPHWHKPTDMIDKLKIDLIIETSKAMVGVLAYAAEIQ